MEKEISRRIVRGFLEKLEECLEVDAAVVGAGPSGLLCAHDLARAGKRVALFERSLKPGGGIWGGAMLFNEIVFQEQALPILDELGIRHSRPQAGLATADAIETAAGLIYRTIQAGARLFNGVTVEDLVLKQGRVAGVVINWSPVLDRGLHVDPLVVEASAVLDAGGHGAELTARLASKAGVRLATPTGGVPGEGPMWAERGEEATVAGTSELFPGLFVSGMAANGVQGAFRMGPIFGGMLFSGRKAARLILERCER